MERRAAGDQNVHLVVVSISAQYRLIGRRIFVVGPDHMKQASRSMAKISNHCNY